ncbi:MAG: hypothetical protein U0670_01380 [Anaerolineae bacterium]
MTAQPGELKVIHRIAARRDAALDAIVEKWKVTHGKDQPQANEQRQQQTLIRQQPGQCPFRSRAWPCGRGFLLSHQPVSFTNSDACSS